jgi:hypothetical protein
MIRFTHGLGFCCCLWFWTQVTLAQSTLSTQDQLMMWGTMDGDLEDQTRLQLVDAQLQSARAHLPRLLELYQMRSKLVANGNVSQNDLESARRDLNRQEHRIARLEYEIAHISLGMKISALIFDLMQQKPVNLADIQEAYWSRWEARCQVLKASHREIVVERDYHKWHLNILESLLQGEYISREEWLNAVNELDLAEFRARSLAGLVEQCSKQVPTVSFALR